MRDRDRARDEAEAYHSRLQSMPPRSSSDSNSFASEKQRDSSNGFAPWARDRFDGCDDVMTRCLARPSAEQGRDAQPEDITRLFEPFED